MWKPPIDFLTLHYAWIITLSILSLVIIYPYGNLRAIDAYFFGASSSTESGLNTVDVKALKTYQQVYVYLIPILGNLGFINIIVVVVRLRWFEKRLKAVAPHLLRPQPSIGQDAEAQLQDEHNRKVVPDAGEQREQHECEYSDENQAGVNEIPEISPSSDRVTDLEVDTKTPMPNLAPFRQTIQFADEGPSTNEKALYIPPPWRRDRGAQELQGFCCLPNLTIMLRPKGKSIMSTYTDQERIDGLRRRQTATSIYSTTTRPLEQAASMMFRVGGSASSTRAPNPKRQFKNLALPNISTQATQSRNSQFHNLTAEDRQKLGGIEYRSLKLLLKIVIGYFVGLHLFGAICLVGWILHSDSRYRDYLAECGQGDVWWGFYSSQTMISNLGFTLTPDSMVHFQDATFPLIVMSFLAFAGNTCYPCLLRLIIWLMYKLCPQNSSMKETLSFLLDHPRRCFTLLFPSKPTWILFGILFVMNAMDVIFIIVLDLHNPAVDNLPAGPRVLAAIFQAASTRHTGTAIFNLADVNPAVQFSLVVMMYIAVFPIAISVRASNVYEEKTLGVYTSEAAADEKDGSSYIITHIQNQLSFDLWYIFLGCFCICIAESGKIADTSIPAFSVFSVLFEVVSAYANVGLSLGFPTNSASLSGEFTTFSKLVICFMMIRGRHRGLPYSIDRAIVLPGENFVDRGEDGVSQSRELTQ
ncbi:hypothetical protein N7476_011384 [Penicillium atrosanguineum]|uniref:Potassium transport protein n=1 Tax=Penicillium atrosanguineum TaxID=1132637 RepID=A0A9W9PPD7_9EURO|nr:hypothetical protein N7526_010667 [Penicillium atrosanguineum]KAJ5299827.1 hypothetical protein N7476_011384 [Penicillium atrosanguineum]